jgi:hypothetical protein
VQLFQGTPLLMQLFLAYFGLALFGINVSAWVAAGVALTLYTSAFLTEIWRGCVAAIPKGQWEAAQSLALSFGEQLRYVILPQAVRIAIPPTVGFLVQVIKGTALASVIGFIELTKAGTMITNATFKPFTVYTCVALMYFALCYPVAATPNPWKENSMSPTDSPVAIVASQPCASPMAPTRCSRASTCRCSRRGHRHHRQERLGQEHAAALHQRAGSIPARQPDGGRQAAAARQPRPCANCASTWA